MVTAQRLLKQFNDLRGISQATIEQLSQVKGIGPAKACQIKAAFELANRVNALQREQVKYAAKNPADVVGFVRERLKDKPKEYFLAVLLDTRGQIIRTSEVSVGTLDASLVHPREVFREAVAANAQSVILVHNHPSGDPAPSPEDLAMNKRLKEAGEVVGISVLDHIIIGNPEYVSLT
jgi:DNA repair protein RadC